MPAAIRTGVNCLVVAGLTVGGVLAFVNLPEFMLEPLKWAGQRFDEPLTTVIWFVYTVLVWSAVAGAIAGCMLCLKPGNVVVYGLVSVATFIITAQSWSITTNAAGYLRELVLVLAIPVLYWFFAQLSGRRQGNA